MKTRNDIQAKLKFVEDNVAFFRVINEVLPPIFRITLVSATIGLWLYAVNNPKVLLVKYVLVGIIFAQLMVSITPSSWMNMYKWWVFSGIALGGFLVLKLSGL